jgi:hypothetical protein
MATEPPPSFQAARGGLEPLGRIHERRRPIDQKPDPLDRRQRAKLGGRDQPSFALLSGEVRINRGTRVQVERRDRLLMHLFQHQIHDRGQAHAMLSGTRIKPPQLDEFFSIAEAPLRASEFAGLGWTEETVWGPTLS